MYHRATLCHTCAIEQTCIEIHQRIAVLSSNCDLGPLSQKSAEHMQNRKTKTNTHPSPDPNRYRRRCPDPNAGIQKFIHYMAVVVKH